MTESGRLFEADPHYCIDTNVIMSFLSETDEQLQLAKQIVSQYPVYAKTINYLGDLEVMTLAGALRLKVITLELPEQQWGQKRPKIPNVCEEFGTGCLSVTGFLHEIRGRDQQL